MKINSFVLGPESDSSNPPGVGSGGGQPPSVSSGGGAGSSTPAQSASAPAQYQPPAGHRVVPDADYGRYESSYKALSAMGFNDPKELDQFKPLLEAVRNRKDDPTMLANMLLGRKDEPRPQSQNAPLDIEKIKADLLADLDRKNRWDNHKRRSGEVDKTLEAKVIEMLGGKDDPLVPIFTKALRSEVFDKHFESAKDNQDVLSGRLPMDYQDAIIEQILNTYGETAKKIRGNKLADIGKAANAARPTTAAGNSGNQGKPGGPDDSDRPLALRSRESKVDAVRKVLDRVKGNT
jgi:hypothetical protein